MKGGHVTCCAKRNNNKKWHQVVLSSVCVPHNSTLQVPGICKAHITTIKLERYAACKRLQEGQRFFLLLFNQDACTPEICLLTLSGGFYIPAVKLHLHLPQPFSLYVQRSGFCVISYAPFLCELKHESEKFPWLVKLCVSPQFLSSLSWIRFTEFPVLCK